jgi:undecaprenyl-diphosphatase
VELGLVVKALLLGLIEGLTEFIPVSSTAHLLLSSKLLDFSAISNGVFEVIIQLGAILAVCVLYRKRIFEILLTFHKKQQSRNFILNVIIAFLPAAILGFFFHGIVKSVFFSPIVISYALIIGGVVIMVVERLNIKPKYQNINKISKLQSLYIGLFQVVSMIPGVSRSGATIIGGLVLKLDRKTATEFSFFLSIPTIFAASLYDFYKNYQSFDYGDLELIFIGFISAFISSLLIIKWFIRYVASHNFTIFAYYRIILGLFLIFVI